MTSSRLLPWYLSGPIGSVILPKLRLAWDSRGPAGSFNKVVLREWKQAESLYPTIPPVHDLVGGVLLASEACQRNYRYVSFAVTYVATIPGLVETKSLLLAGASGVNS
ncbi:hypothetical protein G9A89_000553 [Geosiphon pyriformis]|nr:hypothetical protein G9A89_000553 [Geosiphon pyriformis]